MVPMLLILCRSAVNLYLIMTVREMFAESLNAKQSPEFLERHYEYEEVSLHHPPPQKKKKKKKKAYLEASVLTITFG